MNKGGGWRERERVDKEKLLNKVVVCIYDSNESFPYELNI